MKRTHERVRPIGTEGAIRQWHDGSYWFLNHRSKGWHSFGYSYSSLEEIMEWWAIRIGEPCEDEHGKFWPYELVAEAGQ